MLDNAKLYWIAAGFGCMVIYWALDAVMLHMIAGGLLEKQRRRDSIRVTMIGQFFNSITPLSGAGQPVQAYVMIKDGMKAGHAVSILLIKTLLHQLGIVSYSIAAFAFFGVLFGSKIPHFYALFALGLLVNMAFLVFYLLVLFRKELARKILFVVFGVLSRLKFLKSRLEKYLMKADEEIERLSEGAGMLTGNPKMVISLILCQLLQFTFYFGIAFFIHQAIEGNNISVWEMLASQAMITLLSLLIPTPGATGGIEGISYLFYTMFFRREYIIPVILIYRILTYYANIVFGGLFTVFAPEKPLKQAK
jgi:uncharacterized protein (TIRG00374 family)